MLLPLRKQALRRRSISCSRNSGRLSFTFSGVNFPLPPLPGFCQPCRKFPNNSFSCECDLAHQMLLLFIFPLHKSFHISHAWAALLHLGSASMRRPLALAQRQSPAQRPSSAASARLRRRQRLAHGRRRPRAAAVLVLLAAAGFLERRHRAAPAAPAAAALRLRDRGTLSSRGCESQKKSPQTNYHEHKLWDPSW